MACKAYILGKWDETTGAWAALETYIALLRAVNVGGTGKLPMADFRRVLTGLGYRNVETYIQSGNAVFDAEGTAEQVGGDLAAALERLAGAPVGVILRTPSDLSRIIAENPFAAEAAAEGTRVHVAFLAGRPHEAAQKELEGIVAKYPERRDRFHLAGDVIYFHLPDGAGGTKFSGKPLDRAVGVMGTGRNWNTVLKLHTLSARPKS